MSNDKTRTLTAQPSHTPHVDRIDRISEIMEKTRAVQAVSTPERERGNTGNAPAGEQSAEKAVDLEAFREDLRAAYPNSTVDSTQYAWDTGMGALWRLATSRRTTGGDAQSGNRTEAAAAHFGRELKRLILADADPSVLRCIAHQVPAPVSAVPADDCGNCFEGKSDMDHVCRFCNGTGTVPADWKQQLDAKQAQIDSLMLEYCPNEMTTEQVATWGKHQRAVPAVRVAKLGYRSEEFLTAARVALVSLAHAAEKHGIYQTDYERFAAAIEKFAAPVSPPDIPAPTPQDGVMPEQIIGATAWFHRGMVNFDSEDALALRDDGKGTPIKLYLDPVAAQSAEGSAQVARDRSDAIRYRFLIEQGMAAPERSDTPAPHSEEALELIEAAERMMKWCVMNVDKWNFSQWDDLDRAVTRLKARIDGDKQGAQGDA